MPDDDIRYDYKAEVVLRGTESRVFAQMQTEGWELVREKPGLLRTQLMFRRPRPESAGGHLALAWTVLRTRPEAKAALGLFGIAAVCLIIALVAPTADDGRSEAFGGGGGGAAPAATSEAVPSVDPAVRPAAADSASEPGPILTRKNNEDLARLLALTDYGDESIARFASEYEGRTIAFKGNVAYVANLDDYSRKDCDAEVVRGCDFLFNTGDYDPDSSTGPNVKFEGVDSVDGLHLTGSGTTIRTGDDVRIVAVVDHYDSTKEHLYLDPVSTTLR